MTIPQLKNSYINAVKRLVSQKVFPNVMACPRIIKTTINVGIAKYRKDDKKIESVMNDIAKITGQKPIITKAKKSIAGFSVRKGENVGIKVTLRKDRMYNFLWTLFNIALPRTRDFKGISLKKIDRNGNLTIGLKEHTVFPEIKGDEIRHSFGLEICISVKGGKSRDDVIKLYKELGLPFVFDESGKIIKSTSDKDKKS